MAFFFHSVLLGAALAMDAFSVALADGLAEAHMPRRRACRIAGVFAFFQALMPMTGWLCVHTALRYVRPLERWVPWISLGLLSAIGLSMLRTDGTPRGGGTLALQGVATSLDALSVGFTIAAYGPWAALGCSLIIALVTFVLCLLALRLGRRLAFAPLAVPFGGLLLIVVGLEIFLRGFL